MRYVLHINAMILTVFCTIALKLSPSVAVADSGYVEMRRDRVLVTLELSKRTVRAGKRVSIYRSHNMKRARIIKKVRAKRRITVRDAITSPGLYEYRYKNRPKRPAISFAAIEIAAEPSETLPSVTPTATSTPFPTPFPTPASPCPEALRRELLTLTNAFRISEGLPALRRNGVLELAADLHSQRMQFTSTISHDLWLEEILGAGFVLGRAAQNVVGPAIDSARALDVLLKSPLHRSNILDPRSTLLGIGCTVDTSETPYRVWWTQNFGDAP